MDKQAATVNLGRPAIVSRTMSGYAMLVPLAAILHFGFFGSIAYVVTGVLAFAFFALVLKRVKRLPDSASMFFDTLSNRGRFVFMLLIALHSMAILCMQAVAGGMILSALFGIQSPMSSIVCVFFLFGFSVLRKIRFGWLTFVVVPLYFATAILLPLYFFLTQGVAEIYNGVSLYHPYLLVASPQDIAFFAIANTLIAFGQLLLQSVSWGQTLTVRNNRVGLVFYMSGIVWGTLSLAFSSLVWLMIYKGPFQNMQSIVSDIFHQIHSSSLLVLFVLCLSSATYLAFVTEFETLTNVWRLILNRHFQSSIWRRELLSWIALSLLFVILSLFLYRVQPDLIRILMLFGVIYGGAIPPILLAVLGRNRYTNITAAIALIGILVGYGTIPLIGDVKAVLLSFLVSLIASFLIGPPDNA